MRGARRSRSRTATAVLVVVLAGSGAACSAGSSEPAPPAGSHWVTSPRSHVVIPVQDSWRAVDAREAANDNSEQESARLAEIASRLHVEMTDLRQQLSSLDMVLVGTPSDGSAPTITLDMQGMEDLPTDGQLYQELAPVAAAGVDIKRFHSAVGDALTASYDLQPTAGGASVRLTALKVDEGVLLMAVTSADGATSKEIETRTLEHIHRKG